MGLVSKHVFFCRQNFLVVEQDMFRCSFVVMHTILGS